VKDQPVNIVWFKRDLRVEDHEPLVRAAEDGPVLGLFIYEPELYCAGEFDPSHLVFLNECLAQLEQALTACGGALVTRHGEAVEVLDKMADELPVKALLSHEETGNMTTYQRDRRVAAWATRRGIGWQEFRQDGVVRKLQSRNGWSARWAERMNRPAHRMTKRLVSPRGISSAGLLSPADLALPESGKPEAQRGGLREAAVTLVSFLQERGANYRADMSSPVTGWNSCSRLSPYLAFGCVSLKTVNQAVVRQVAELRAVERSGGVVDRRWFGSLSSFGARLRWHCHFMQKLEDEPRIEFRNFSRAFDGLREEFSATPEAQERLRRWQAGTTGYPMVDACMRAVQVTGWLNFRMRAMVASFAAYHLWLHWREPSVFLARHFLDFEPGIHFSQFQMQSGTTGINTLRIYSPAKQALEQDPKGVFIRRWIPELSGVPESWLSQPHLMPLEMQQRCGCLIGADYPAPIVDHQAAVVLARQRLAAVRKRPESRTEAKRVLGKHGSRKRPARGARARSGGAELDLAVSME
jgi:deoxyribodipyrimidine photo-lyase